MLLESGLSVIERARGTSALTTVTGSPNAGTRPLVSIIESSIHRGTTIALSGASQPAMPQTRERPLMVRRMQRGLGRRRVPVALYRVPRRWTWGHRQARNVAGAPCRPELGEPAAPPLPSQVEPRREWPSIHPRQLMARATSVGGRARQRRTKTPVTQRLRLPCRSPPSLTQGWSLLQYYGLEDEEDGPPPPPTAEAASGK